ncbi:Copine-5 [Desmophyllum pertusum]|uniref:Copine-5 n=1 Tax=Desmophyllum pertusum TaxID=174260 RepID=A0A9X0CEJ2_9CNID|nr:Copine-5 [Desmophyllum pertusum]
MAASAPPAYHDVVSPGEASSFRSSVPATQVELHVSCRNLADMDVFSKSDPMVVMYTQGMGSKEWREFGRTEHIMNTLNPDFVKTFVIHYFFEEMQKLRFEVYDIDKNSAKLSDHDFLGATECTLGSIVGEFGGRLQKQLMCWGNNVSTVLRQSSTTATYSPSNSIAAEIAAKIEFSYDN